MKLAVILGLLLLAACSAPQPPVSSSEPSSSSSASSSASSVPPHIAICELWITDHWASCDEINAQPDCPKCVV